MRIILKRINKLLPVISAICLFLAMNTTVFAGNLPMLESNRNQLSLNSGTPSDTIKFSVSNWKLASPYTVMLSVADPTVASAELDSQNGYDFKVRVRAKASGTTIVKVWLDGFSRSCKYIIVDSMIYNKKKVDNITVGDYGYATGTLGECAKIVNYTTEATSSGTKLWVYFSFVDRGMGTGDSVTFRMNCYNSSESYIGIASATGTGLMEGGAGYKLAFRLPAGTTSVKLENMDY